MIYAPRRWQIDSRRVYVCILKQCSELDPRWPLSQQCQTTEACIYITIIIIIVSWWSYDSQALHNETNGATHCLVKYAALFWVTTANGRPFLHQTMRYIIRDKTVLAKYSHYAKKIKTDCLQFFDTVDLERGKVQVLPKMQL